MENEEIVVPEVTPEALTPEAESSPAVQPEPVQPSEEDLVRKRIDKIVWQREEARREAEHWKKQAQAVKPEPKPEFVDPNKPNVNDPKFSSYDEYTEALAEWKIEQRLQKAHSEYQTRTESEKRNESLKVFNERADKVRTKYPDYDELFENANVSEAMAGTILESENGPEIVVYLSKNPDVANRIAMLSPTQAAREIGKIEAKLDSLLVTKTVTDASPPLNPVKPKGDTDTGLSDNIDVKTWMKRRNKQLGR